MTKFKIHSIQIEISTNLWISARFWTQNVIWISQATRIRSKYPDRVPVICEKAARSGLPNIEKKKFLVPGTMLVGEFKYIIHKHINQCTSQGAGGSGGSIAADQTIYLFTDSYVFFLKSPELMIIK